MEQITLRLPEDVLGAVEQEAEEQGISRAEYLRDVIRSRNESDADVSELEAKVSELEAELQEQRSRADRAEGKLEGVDARIEDKNGEIERLQQELERKSNEIGRLTDMTAAANKKADERLPANQRSSLFGGLRSRIFGSDDEQD